MMRKTVSTALSVSFFDTLLLRKPKERVATVAASAIHFGLTGYIFFSCWASDSNAAYPVICFDIQFENGELGLPK